MDKNADTEPRNRRVLVKLSGEALMGEGDYGIDPDVPVTADAEEVLRALTWTRRQGQNPPEHWFTTLADPPRPGPVRDELAG